MPANRHQRRARAARSRRTGQIQRRVRPRGLAARLAFVLAGMALIVVPVLMLATIHGTRVPRGLLLIPVVGCALLALAIWS